YLGPIEGPLVPANGVTIAPGDMILDAALAPEGDELFITLASSNQMLRYAIDAAGDCSLEKTYTLPTALNYGAVTRGPQRHILGSDSISMQEFVIGDTALTAAGVTSISALQVSSINQAPNLNEDGTRAIFAAMNGSTLQVYYTDRSDPTGAFTP